MQELSTVSGYRPFERKSTTVTLVSKALDPTLRSNRLRYQCEIGSGPTSTTTGGNLVSSEALLQEEHNLKGMDPVQKVWSTAPPQPALWLALFLKRYGSQPSHLEPLLASVRVKRDETPGDPRLVSIHVSQTLIYIYIYIYM